jgi:hypothetical protein
LTLTGYADLPLPAGTYNQSKRNRFRAEFSDNFHRRLDGSFGKVSSIVGAPEPASSIGSQIRLSSRRGACSEFQEFVRLPRRPCRSNFIVRSHPQKRRRGVRRKDGIVELATGHHEFGVCGESSAVL